MKKLLLALCVLPPLTLAQETPNIGLNLPNFASPNWNTPLNQNFSTLDLLLSGNQTLTGLAFGQRSAPAAPGSGEGIIYLNQSDGLLHIRTSASDTPIGSGGLNQLTGDGTAGPGNGSQVFTLASVNSSSGSCGDATHVCQLFSNAKGLVTSQSSVAISVGTPTINTFSATGGVGNILAHGRNTAYPAVEFFDSYGNSSFLPWTANLTTLTSSISSSATTIPVASGAGIANGDTLSIAGDAMTVTAGAGTTSLTVTRSGGSTSHSSGAYVVDGNDIVVTPGTNITGWTYDLWATLPLGTSGGGGGGSGTVNSGATGQLAYYASNGTVVSGGTLGGDLTLSGASPATATLNTVNSSPGACGDSTHVCQVTTNGKGLVTSQSAVLISGGGGGGGTTIIASGYLVTYNSGTGCLVIQAGVSASACGSGSATETARVYIDSSGNLTVATPAGTVDVNCTGCTWVSGTSFPSGSQPIATWAIVSGAFTSSGGMSYYSNVPTTFATLDACGAGLSGMSKAITDGPASPAWGATVSAGGGSQNVKLYCDGANWTVAAK